MRGLLAPRRRDAECGTHGVVPRVHDGCMKCGAGTVAARPAPTVAARAASSAVMTDSGLVRVIDLDAGAADEDDDGWDAGW